MDLRASHVPHLAHLSTGIPWLRLAPGQHQLDHRLSPLRPPPRRGHPALTRIQTRSAEQPINLDEDDDVFNYPWLYAVEVGHWELTDSQIAKFREFLLRGGFFMCDDFHGTEEWSVFINSMKRSSPAAPSWKSRTPTPSSTPYSTWTTATRSPACSTLQPPRLRKGRHHPRWRGIYDDHGRLMVAICHDMDLGDSWENADEPQYPQKFSALGIRIGINYIIYAMTH